MPCETKQHSFAPSNQSSFDGPYACLHDYYNLSLDELEDVTACNHDEELLMEDDDEQEKPAAPPLDVHCEELFPLLEGERCFSMAVTSSDEETIFLIKKFPKLFFFSSFWPESYSPLCADFGPVNLCAVHKFCQELEALFNDKRLCNRHLVFYADNQQATLLNACFLLGAFLVLHCSLSPDQAAERLTCLTSRADPEFNSFRDASFHPDSRRLSLSACLHALHAAAAAQVYVPSAFDAEEYMTLDDPRAADLHQICSKLIAFRGPSSLPLPPGQARGRVRGPEAYVRLFKAMHVTDVVRLNEAAYSADEFTAHGFRHHHLPFLDGGLPPPNVIEEFMRAVDAAPGRLAVHCHAGLGRTGTVIALYLMRTLRWSAQVSVAWLRIVRPGSVTGAQLSFLAACDHAVWHGSRMGFPPTQPRLPLCGGGGEEEEDEEERTGVVGGDHEESTGGGGGGGGGGRKDVHCYGMGSNLRDCVNSSELLRDRGRSSELAPNTSACSEQSSPSLSLSSSPSSSPSSSSFSSASSFMEEGGG